jgi:hypothetical protein
MARTPHLPPADQDGRYGPDFPHGIDLERGPGRPRRPRWRWITAVVLVLAALAVVGVARLCAPTESAPPDGVDGSGIAQAVTVPEARFEHALDPGFALTFQEQ